VLVPENVKRVKKGLGTVEKEIAELRLTIRIETDYFAVQYAAAAAQVTC